MSRFPDLLSAQRRALFDIVEAFRQHKMEGRAVLIVTELGNPRLILSMGEESPQVDTDFDTLRVLDEAGYVTFTETPHKGEHGLQWVDRTLILRKLASDYYDWCHNPPWYKPIVEIWFSLAPDTRSAFVGAMTTFLLGSLTLLIRACLSR